MSRKQAIQAAREKHQPYLFEEEDRDTFPPFPFPNIGSYRPKGWKLVNSLFCDSSGMGSVGEPALTCKQLIDRLRVGYGYAIIETGEFQAYIGEFEKTN